MDIFKGFCSSLSSEVSSPEQIAIHNMGSSGSPFASYSLTGIVYSEYDVTGKWDNSMVTEDKTGYILNTGQQAETYRVCSQTFVSGAAENCYYTFEGTEPLRFIYVTEINEGRGV